MTTQIQFAEPRFVTASKLVRLKHDNGLGVTNGTKRGRLEIFAEILFFCDQRKAKTHNVQNKLELCTVTEPSKVADFSGPAFDGNGEVRYY